MPEPTGPQFNPEQEPEQEKLSEKERKEKEAFLEIAEKFKEKSQELNEHLIETPTFKAKGRRFEMENEIDYLVASSQAEIKLAQELKKEAQDYYKIKGAGKLIHFLKARAQFLKAYAELKSYYPEFSGMFEERMPHLKRIYKKAKKSWNKFK